MIEEDIRGIIEAVGVEAFREKMGGKTVLVMGATGMVGQYLVYTLAELNRRYGLKIRILAGLRDPKKFDRALLNEGVEVYEHDITEEFSDLISGEVGDFGAVDFVIHAASPASPKIMKEKPLETNWANTLGMANVIKLAIAKKSKVLFVSSREIYGEPLSGETLFAEDGALGQVDPLIPRNGYAEGKKAAENMCAAAVDEYGLDAKIVRLAHTYGPGMSVHDGRVQADFLKNILNGENIVMKSSGEAVRTYTYISDAATAMWLALLKGERMVYNIADERAQTTIRGLAETLLTLPEAKGLELIFAGEDENKKGTAAFTTGILSTERIRGELGWSAKYGIREGFERTLRHLREVGGDG